MVTTYCTRCEKELDVAEFENYDKCPYCGRSFMTIQYVALTVFCGFFILATWIVYELSSGRIPKKIPLFVESIFGILFISNILTDQILLRTSSMTRLKRKGIAIYISVASMLIFAYIMRPYIV